MSRNAKKRPFRKCAACRLKFMYLLTHGKLGSNKIRACIQ